MPDNKDAPAEGFDAKAAEAELKETEKRNLAEMDDKKTDDGQTKYAGGPIPPASK